MEVSKRQYGGLAASAAVIAYALYRRRSATTPHTHTHDDS